MIKTVLITSLSDSVAVERNLIYSAIVLCYTCCALNEAAAAGSI
jgi:hypothetical protein